MITTIKYHLIFKYFAWEIV